MKDKLSKTLDADIARRCSALADPVHAVWFAFQNLQSLRDLNTPAPRDGYEAAVALYKGRLVEAANDIISAVSP